MTTAGRPVVSSLSAALVLLVASLSAALVLLVASPSPAPASQAAPDGPDRAVVVASKPFAESYLLGEVFAQLLEREGFSVERRLGLGATDLAFRAVRGGSVDVYPEYTGTGLIAILGETPTGDAREVHERVSRVFQRRWGVLWLPPLGFENTYAVAVRRETAERYGLETLSDLPGVAERLVAGFSPDFIGREDGLPGLSEAYGISFRAVRSLLQAVKYEALAGGRVDVIDGYATDGAIARYDLEILEDDRGFFPPYDAAPLVSPALARDHPAAVAVLARTAGRFDAPLMRELNRRLEVEGEPLARVARVGLVRAGLAPGSDTLGRVTGSGDAGDTARRPADARAGPSSELAGTREESWWRYVWTRRADLWTMTLRHLLLAGGSLLAAVLLAVPLGLALERRRESAEGVIRAVGVLQTIPSIALLAFMIPLLGIGVLPAMVALFLYSLFPILRNTFTGVRDADPTAVAAARAVGMTPWQLLRYVRLPLAAPVIMAGVRTAAVINIGTATLAAFIGAGGLGDPIVSGLALSDVRMILFGAVPAALLALVVDATLGAAERVVTPEGLDPSGAG